jgi:hypothetical protein
LPPYTDRPTAVNVQADMVTPPAISSPVADVPAAVVLSAMLTDVNAKVVEVTVSGPAKLRPDVALPEADRVVLVS